MPGATALLLALAVQAPPAWVPPPPSAAVSDPAGVLAPEVEASLARRLARYEAASGHQVVVWLGRTSGGVPIEEFAVATFEAWKIGRAGLDDGLAVFALTDDRALRVEVGYDLESRVTDAMASQVLRTIMIPAIRRGAWDQAIVGGVESLVDTIEGHAGALPADPGAAPIDEAPPIDLPTTIVTGVLVALFLLFFITNPRRALMLLIFIGRSGGFGGGGFGGRRGGGGFRGGGGHSGGGGATGRW